MSDGPETESGRLPPSLRRVVGLIRKESLQMIRDPSSLLIGVILPLVLLFLFGVGVSLDLKRVTIGLVIEQPTPETSSFVAALRNSRWFEVREARHRRAFEDALVTGELKGIVVLAADFAARSQRGQATPVQILIDGSDPNTAGLVQNYIIGTWENWRTQWLLENLGSPPPAVEPQPRIWFNPELNSRDFLLPGSVGIIMALIGTLLTALVVAREWERGTMEALLATPAGVVEILIGKLLPYFALGMVAMAMCVAISVWGFGMPFRGSVGALAAVSAVFLVAMLALGLLISTLARNQFVASQFAIVTAFLPAFLLSGFIFEITSMPWPIRTLTRALPARYLVSSLQTIFLAGDVAAVLVPDLIALGVIAGVLLLLVARTTRTTLD
jgi:ABC-2 type transport system permease protein